MKTGKLRPLTSNDVLQLSYQAIAIAIAASVVSNALINVRTIFRNRVIHHWETII